LVPTGHAHGLPFHTRSRYSSHCSCFWFVPRFQFTILPYTCLVYPHVWFARIYHGSYYATILLLHVTTTLPRLPHHTRRYTLPFRSAVGSLCTVAALARLLTFYRQHTHLPGYAFTRHGSFSVRYALLFHAHCRCRTLRLRHGLHGCTHTHGFFTDSPVDVQFAVLPYFARAAAHTHRMLLVCAFPSRPLPLRLHTPHVHAVTPPQFARVRVYYTALVLPHTRTFGLPRGYRLPLPSSRWFVWFWFADWFCHTGRSVLRLALRPPCRLKKKATRSTHHTTLCTPCPNTSTLYPTFTVHHYTVRLCYIPTTSSSFHLHVHALCHTFGLFLPGLLHCWLLVWPTLPTHIAPRLPQLRLQRAVTTVGSVTLHATFAPPVYLFYAYCGSRSPTCHTRFVLHTLVHLSRLRFIHWVEPAAWFVTYANITRTGSQFTAPPPAFAVPTARSAHLLQAYHPTPLRVRTTRSVYRVYTTHHTPRLRLLPVHTGLSSRWLRGLPPYDHTFCFYTAPRPAYARTVRALPVAGYCGLVPARYPILRCWFWIARTRFERSTVRSTVCDLLIYGCISPFGSALPVAFAILLRFTVYRSTVLRFTFSRAVVLPTFTTLRVWFVVDALHYGFHFTLLLPSCVCCWLCPVVYLFPGLRCPFTPCVATRWLRFRLPVTVYSCYTVVVAFSAV